MKRTCVVCNKEISQDRIEAIPETGLCMEHSKRASELGGEFILVPGVELTSKQGSLKKNYSGISGFGKFINEDVIDILRKEYDTTCSTAKQPKEIESKSEYKKHKKQQDKGFDEFGEKLGTKRSAVNIAICNGANKLSTIVIESKQSKDFVTKHIGKLILERLVELNKRNEIVPVKRKRNQ